MTDTPANPVPAHAAFRVLAALADLGEATAAAIADHTGLGYSTVTPRLRAWEASGHAEKYRNQQNQTLWRLTANGRAATATSGEHAEAPVLAAAPTSDETAIPIDADALAGTDEPDTTEGENVDKPQDGGRVDEPRDATVAADVASAPPEDTVEPGRGEQPSPTPADPAGNESGPQSAPELGNPAAADTGAGTGAETARPSGDRGDATTEKASGGRRPSGSLRGAILDVLEAHRGHGYKVSELCRLIDRADEGTGAKKAGQGAVANAAHKLVEHGQVQLLVERPAVFGLPADDA